MAYAPDIFEHDVLNRGYNVNAEYMIQITLDQIIKEELEYPFKSRVRFRAPRVTNNHPNRRTRRSNNVR